MKEQIIQIPDTLEIKEIKDGKIILVEKEKKLTYDDAARKLFPDNEIHYYIESGAQINTIVNRKFNYTCKNNANSKKQLEKRSVWAKPLVAAPFCCYNSIRTLNCQGERGPAHARRHPHPRLQGQPI